jgi:hypothetical protein
MAEQIPFVCITYQCRLSRRGLPNPFKSLRRSLQGERALNTPERDRGEMNEGHHPQPF